MGNPIFGNQKPQAFQAQPFQAQPNGNQQIDFNALYNQFQENPSKYLKGLDIPQEAKTPEQIVRHLAATNQIHPLIQKQVYGMLARIDKK